MKLIFELVVGAWRGQHEVHQDLERRWGILILVLLVLAIVGVPGMEWPALIVFLPFSALGIVGVAGGLWRARRSRGRLLALLWPPVAVFVLIFGLSALAGAVGVTGLIFLFVTGALCLGVGMLLGRRGHRLVEPAPPVPERPPRIVGAAVSPQGTQEVQRLGAVRVVGALAPDDPFTCGIVPEGTTILARDNETIVSSEDPNAHPGALVRCYGPPRHQGRHTWETVTR